VSLLSSPAGSRRAFPARPVLCYVTDRQALPSSSHEDWLQALVAKIAAVASAGVDWIQIREKDLSGRASASLVGEAMRQISASGQFTTTSPRLIVNDRLDVALAEGAGGVHLGENSLPVAEAKRLVLLQQAGQRLTSDFVVGVSCHSLEAAKSAEAAGANYIFFGPVFATPSKASYGAPQGLARLAEVCVVVNIPVLAIGGITLENAASCISCGAAGIAAIRLFQDAPDPAVIVRAIRQGNS
jgi:thiamine-phosphate pyrophosphorylase